MNIRLSAVAAALVLCAPEVALAASTTPASTPAASPFSGNVTQQSSAGQGEATLLSETGIIESAHETFGPEGYRPPGSVLVFVGKDAPDFSDWIELSGRMQLIKDQLEGAVKESQSLHPPQESLPPPPPHKGPQESRLLGGATDVVAGAVQLASYFSTDYQFSGEAVTPDDYLYAAAVASELARTGVPVTLANQIVAPEALERLLFCKSPSGGPEDPNCFAVLDNDRKLAADEITFLNKNHPIVIARLTAAIAAYDGLIATLAPPPKPAATPDPAATKPQAASQGAFSLGKAVQEKAVFDALREQSDSGLFLKVHTATGGDYTYRNLWTLLGVTGLPIRMSGGAVVSWVEIDRHGHVEEAGVVPIYSRYENPDAIRRRVDRTRTAHTPPRRFNCTPVTATGYTCTPRP